MKLRKKTDRGLTLVETLVAVSLLFIVSSSLLTLGVFSISTTENQGHLAARTAEYSEDKMEQLLAMAYGDSTSDSTQIPTANSGGSGLAVGGSSDPASPVNQYVDYLDGNGNVLGGGMTAPGGWFYKRVWAVSTPSGTTNTKQITVTTIVIRNVGGRGLATQATLTAIKVNPF